ncbi:hypothetical protein SDRG_15528 [Saprolegnia diclina VS20]|uniref:TIR domain-containing protein n=1 Tax=Saprolegnia diclina (strain VS20) TaxID=1156394 RepID=T0R3F7_SAPDV|nr:hypothetical protein SDRG_15528 [Saprolegnia diclina VS20]EQC26588.1 hypothetical protein SDRG_15528 [Saprolegnia diclina VS20]|eukprot:XP_008619926.1 hypothetical protein SDRG_15528 [Saprolegnia diclina VS20]
MPKYLYHVFLTHDWGIDEAGRDNHERVSRINNVLKANDIVTWFDADRMRGNIKKMMADGIDHSALAAVFITQRYMEKVNGTNQNDNCQLEFGMAGNTQTAARIVPIVMETRMKNLANWKGEFKLMLGTLLYMDATSDTTLEQFALELVVKIKEMLADTNLFPEQDDVIIDAAASAVLVQKSAESEAPPPLRSNAVAPMDVPRGKAVNHWKPWRLLVVAGTAAIAVIAVHVVCAGLDANTNAYNVDGFQSITDSNAAIDVNLIADTNDILVMDTVVNFANDNSNSSINDSIKDSASYSLSTVWNASSLNGDPYLLGITSAVSQIIMSVETGLLSWATGNPGANVWLTSGSPGYPLTLAADRNGNIVYADPLTSKITARQSCR